MKIWNQMKTRSKLLITLALICTVSFTFLATSDKDFKIAKNLDIFVTLFREIDYYYVDEKDPEELINAGIQGMLETLDPYTNYIPESDMDDFKFMITGQYGGIGALIRKAGDYTLISEPYEGSPAIKAGLRAGDTIFSINGSPLKGKSISDVSEMLKGEPNTELKLVLKRPGDTASFLKTFTRETITIKNVPYSGFVESGIGYIRLTGFTKDASKEVRNAFTDLKSKGAKSVILDLRGNPGGQLNEAVDIANIWVAKEQEIVSTHGKTKQWDSEYKTSKSAVDTAMPIAVLVNRGSASASEIVAGALQDLDRAIVIGQRTFGKGLVQTTRPLSYNTYLKVTTAKYYIPSGRCIQAVDYTHRNEDGSVGHVPDSLIKAFTTKNGRTVYDGGGILPDFTIDVKQPPNIALSLYANNLIFDYATIFTTTHDSINSPASFDISDETYSDFLNYVKKNKFDYSTTSNEQLDELVKITKAEGYYDVAKTEIEALREKLSADKEKDLMTFRGDIKDLLRDEIVGRYYYQSGRIITNMRNDEQLEKAIELLKEPGAVSSVLHGKYIGSDVKLALEKK